MTAVANALQTLERLRIPLHAVRCIDVGGTRKVYLEATRAPAQTSRRRLADTLRRMLGARPLAPTTVVTVTDNPLLAVIPTIIFLDQGFNASAIHTTADIEGDFLDEQCVSRLAHSFDLVFSFDTLEHVSDPFKFCHNLVRIAAPGGCVFLSTVFAWEYHPSPQDFFRFSPEGLQECFRGSGAEVLVCGWDVKDVSVFICLKNPS